MEEKEIIITNIGIIIGVLILISGLYYLVKEGKDDAESKKIYTIVSVIGAVIAVGFGISMFFLV